MFFDLKLLAVSVLGLTCLGCTAVRPLACSDRSAMTNCEVPKVGVVRTGGHFRLPQSIPLSNGENLTLRQVGILSGGLLPEEGTFEYVDIAPVSAPQTALKNSDVRQNASLEEKDQVALVTLQTIFGDQNIGRLTALMKKPEDRREQLQSLSNSDASGIEFSTVEPIVFLRSALRSLEAFYDLDHKWQRSGSGENWHLALRNATDWNAHLSLAEEMFAFFRDNDPVYVDELTQKLRELRSLSLQSATSPTSPTVSTLSGSNATTRTQLVQAKSSVQTLLVGLTRNGATEYFHPQLIDQTVIGDLPVRDGDFIFAIEATRTSLNAQIAPISPFYIPVAGIAGLNAQVLSTKRSTLREVLALIEPSQLAADSIMVVERQSGFAGGASRFYLPITVLGTQLQFQSTQQLLDGKPVVPGDTIMFTVAGLAPVVAEERAFAFQQVVTKAKLARLEEASQARLLERSRVSYTKYNSERLRRTANRFSGQLGR